MSRHDSENGYRYTLALCDSIEAYLAETKKKYPSFFMHRGAALEYALSRTLYSSFVNTTRLRDAYASTGSIPLAREIETPRRPVRAFVGTLLRISGCALLIRMLRIFATPKRVKGVRPGILLCVESEQFTRFLEPIVRKLTTPYSFLTYDAGAVTYAKLVGLPCILVPRFGARIARIAHPDGPLSRFGIIEKYDLLEDSFRRIRPMSVVVVEGNAAFDEVVNQLAKKYGASSVCLQQGWSPIFHSGFRDMSYTKMLVWGDGFAKLLAPYNPAQTFITTGSPVLTMSRTQKASGPFTIAFLSQTASPILSKEALGEFLSFVRIVAKRFPTVSVLVREHPRFPLAKKERDALLALSNVTFRSPPTYSLDEVLAQSAISVSVYSSTILESIAAGVVPLIFNVTSMPHFNPDVAAEGAGIEVKNIDDALAALTPLIAHPENLERFRAPMEKFRKEYFSEGKEVAIQKIVKEIEMK